MNKNRALPCTFTQQDVEIISQKILYRGFFTMTEYQFKHRLFRGGWSEIIKREVFERGHAGVLLPYDPVRDEVVLIEQIRIPAIETSDTPWLLEVIAGMIEEGEDAEQVVRREAVEEAGIEVKRCQPALSYLSSPGGTTERMHIFVGEVDAATASGVHGLASEHEDIRVLVVSRKQAYQWVEEGVIDNAASVIAIQWLALHHEKLRKEWLGNPA
ncbi:ADP-ribose diphosphatase [Xenorhabdus kozodoii]|uniref:ADP-ribose pyrophosphatase n=1 Tax=Xenorhabdus kozodoii TaxID=351676 RepID=A0A2D0L925_9GAMM|nr:ADP-ribose diphosphatase [Xenorhabdus kozodoii]PHM72105.1 ADP-ribose diphosphatase [Xenorhabdus kozodoii]